MRRLSEIDLARIAPLTHDEKLNRLRLLKFGRPPHTYNPLRGSIGDVLNLQPEMFVGQSTYTPWPQVVADIVKSSKSDSEKKFNLAVAKALYEFGVKNNAQSFGKPITPWSVGFGQTVRYWWNLYTVINNEPCFIFIDPRITAPLTKIGRKFVLSLMHERIRVADPDFVNSRLLIAQFRKAGANKRAIQIFDAKDYTLFSIDQLNEMIDETYALWLNVLAERSEQAKAKPTGTTPMGF